MAKNKFQWKRPELSLQEVTEQKDCTVEDLLHEAANGDLTIYVKAEGWKVALICSIKRVIKAALPETKYITTSEEYDAFITERELKEDIKIKEDFEAKFDVKMDALKQRIAFEEVHHIIPTDGGFQKQYSIGAMTFYPNRGINRPIYMTPLFGLQPISAFTIGMYRNGLDSGIYLKLINSFGIFDNSPRVFFILPAPLITIQEALRDNKLFVLKEDLEKLTSNESVDPDNAKGKDDVSRKTLLQLVLGMAMDQYKYDPDKKRTDVSKAIEVGLGILGIKVSDDTIRNALQEAKSKIPHKPAQILPPKPKF